MDNSKVNCILDWPIPTCAKEVWRFLGLVQYISVFLPALVEHTALLTPLVWKECNTIFPMWTTEHHHTFEAIKALVVSCDCLTMIDHHNLGENKIFVTCDASQWHTSAVLFWTNMGDCQTSCLWKLSTSWHQTSLPCPWIRDAFNHMGPQKVAMWPPQFGIHNLH